MSKSSNDPRTRERSKTIAQEHEAFLGRHRLMLLRYLDGTAPGSPKEPDALGYVESVLMAWQQAFGQCELTDPGPEERTFWCALYQLEELAEMPGPHVDPYEKCLMEALIEVRELLRHGRAFPEHRFMATRPDGT